MRYSMKTFVTSSLAVVILCAGWAGFAQVQEKAKTKPAPAQKPGTAAKEPAKKPVEEALKTPAKGAETKTTETKKTTPADDQAESVSADEEAIQGSAASFIAAYNAHDAKALSELFALKAEFTDEDGNLIQGRAAIEDDFTAMFEKCSDCKIDLEISSIRILTPNLAVEEGLVHGLPIPDEPSNTSGYIAVHVKVDGHWLLASVSDYAAPAEELTANDHLQDLAWMVGDWRDESSDSVLKTSCQWDESGNYLLHDFVLDIADGASASGSMRIGWDPQTKQLKSWTFDADSGYSQGLWIRIDDEWMVKANGVNAAGQTTTAVNVFRYIDNDTMTWRSYDRVVGGEPVEDIQEYIIKRHAPPPEG